MLRTLAVAPLVSEARVMIAKMNQDLGSQSASMVCSFENLFVLKLCILACGRRSAISRCREVKNRAFSGVSGRIQRRRIPQTKVRQPRAMKSTLERTYSVSV